ncbi:MAG: response regulator [bacterium]|nr:response regulator [bacterium]
MTPEKETILIVDDTPENIDVLKGILSPHFKIKAATNGEKALVIASGENPPDLVLLDIMMPGMDGYQVCQTLKSQPATAEIPVVFVTAMTEMEDETKGFEVGAVDFLTKPVRPPVVLARVLTHLALRRKSRELSESLQELKTAQDHLIQSEKLSALGQLVAGVAHEINTPLGSIKSSVDTAAQVQNWLLSGFAPLVATLDDKARTLLGEAMPALAQAAPFLGSLEARKLAKALAEQVPGLEENLARKWVSLGLEPNLLVRLAQGPPELLELFEWLGRLSRALANINQASTKAGKILFSLKNYSHFSTQEEKSPANLGEGIEMVLTLYQNLLKQGVEVVTHFEGLPLVPCWPDELAQVWTNLLQNSIQAMKGKGKIEITAQAKDGWIQLSFADNGPGVPDELKEKIFQPFFTTKGAGEGSGLGLDISRKIIEKHGGNIRLESSAAGTTFFINLPLGT